MTTELIVEQKQNLANYFLLPLIKRSARDFFPGLFVNSYLDIETFHIVVEVQKPQTHFEDFSHFDYGVQVRDDKYYYFYTIPEQFHEDVALFVDGKYSQFSEAAKTYIRKFGKLLYRKTLTGEVEKSIWLHVLERSNKLRLKLNQQLGVELPVNIELASKPNNNNFFHNQ